MAMRRSKAIKKFTRIVAHNAHLYIRARSRNASAHAGASVGSWDERSMKEASECIDWKAACPEGESGPNNTYGQAFFYGIGVCNGVSAHRLSYITYVGDIPEGATMGHSCGRKSCITPSHIFIKEIQQEDE